MAKLAILGHATRGKEVIEILEMLGGRNDCNYEGDVTRYIYSIDGKRTINWYISHPDSPLAIFTLEEFLEKFPYKVGDEVLYKTYGIYSRIKAMLWNEEKEQVFYRLEPNKLFVATADELQPYKKEVMKEIKVDIPKGYEFAGVDDGKQQVVFTKVGYHYPQTYKECCKELGHPEALLVDRILGYKGTLLSIFQELLIARDAYLKIAGDAYQLGKPWKPDWEDKTKTYYTISYDGVNIKCYNNTDTYSILAFPTEEMRNAFYENFKDLIEVVL